MQAAVARSPNGTPLFECVCPDCGKVRIQDKRKIGKPCLPCANRRRSTHGLCGHPLYGLLHNMIVRCKYPSATNYRYYGGRGIKVCDEWTKDPAAFVKWAKDNGYAPGLEIDRIDVDGPYAPWNCRFIPHVRNSQLRRNKRCSLAIASSIKAKLKEGLPIRVISEAIGVPYMVVWHISKGNTWIDA